MKTAITVLSIIFAFGFTLSLNAQTDKAEIKFWKNKAKAYKKDPLSLKAEFENYQNQIKDLKRRNKEMAERLSNLEGGAPSGPGNNLTDSLRFNLAQKEQELQTVKQDYAKLESAYRSVQRTNDMGIRPGLIYGVQIGAFVYYKMENAPTDANDVVEEKSDGYNKYVIGNFRTYDEAHEFRGELRKIGVKDAWIVPYLDGVRVTMDEAKDYLKKQENF